MIQIESAGKRKVLRGAGALLAVTVLVAGLAAPASAHRGGGCHRNSGRSTSVYCTVCDGYHTRSDCPNACDTCGYNHTGDCYSDDGHYCIVCDGYHTRGDCPNACDACGYNHTGDCYSGGGHHGGRHH